MYICFYQNEIMKALVLEQVGSKPIYKDVKDPESDSDLAVVELKYAALNHRDVWITKGMYPNINVPVILGSDGAGIYDGKEVIINPGFDWGENFRVQSNEFNILGMPKNGTFAEKVEVDQQYLYQKPAHLTLQEAAAVPLAGVTAYRVLFSRCQLMTGERVLVTGAGGGVATMCIQFALAAGCEVHVTSGDEMKIAEVIGLGVEKGYNYKDGNWYKEIKGGFDVIIDSAGGDSFQNLVKLCNPGARIGFYGASLGKYNGINPQLLFWRQVSIHGSTMGSPSDFSEMINFINEHEIKPLNDSTYSLEDCNEALKRMDKGSQMGKIILEIN